MIHIIKSKFLTSLKSRKINIFLLFLLMSFTILIFTKLSKQYTNALVFSIDKINVPPENIILNDSNTTLKITLKTHGFGWLKYYIKKPRIIIDFATDVDKRGSKFIWSKSKSYLNAKAQFGKQVELIHIDPDTLIFRFDVNLIKKVPVIIDTDVSFSLGYDIYNDFKSEPDSIVVIGPHVLVSEIERIQTEQLVLKEVKSDVANEVALKLPKNFKQLKFSNTKVLLRANVEKFTEGKIKVPVTIVNIPEGMSLHYFPKAVPVTFYTSLSKFNTIAVKDFSVECDYSKITKSESFLIPNLVKLPEAVKSAKINQQRIEFIISE
jgi:hypothetical protein